MSDTIKAQSFVLARALEKLGIRLSHGNALDVMAQLNGAESWNHYLAQQSSHALTEQAAAAQSAVGLSSEDQARIAQREEFYNRPAKYPQGWIEGERMHVLLAVAPDIDAWTELKIEPMEWGLAAAAIRVHLERQGRRFVQYFSATRVFQEGRHQLIDVVPHTFDDLMRIALMVELRTEFPQRRTVQCPLTCRLYRQYEGVGGIHRIVVASVPNGTYGIHPSLLHDHVWSNARERSKKPETANVALNVGEALANYWQKQA